MNEEKRIKEIVSIELTGISRVILEYSTDHFINNYAEKLNDKEFYTDKNMLKYLISKINIWYEEEITKILDSEYVAHKNLHTKSYEIVKELNELLKKNYS